MFDSHQDDEEGKDNVEHFTNETRGSVFEITGVFQQMTVGKRSEKYLHLSFGRSKILSYFSINIIHSLESLSLSCLSMCLCAFLGTAGCYIPDMLPR